MRCMLNKTPNILQILPKLHQTGGVERGTLEIARAIKTQGWGSFVASAGGELLPKLTYAGAQHITLPLNTKNPLVMALNVWRLERVIRANNISLVHARSRAPAWSAYFAAKRAGVPFITTFHGVYGLQGKWKRAYNAVMVRGERVIAVSEFIKAHMLAHYPVDASRIRVIHRGVELKLFTPENVSEQRMVEVFKHWGIPEHLPIILFPGRITRWKGQDVFIKALAQLRGRDFFAVLVGDDAQHPAFKHEVVELIKSVGLEGRVRLVGSTPFMAEAYKLAKMVVATSVEPEAFGRVALEAQAMGKPVIATNHGGARETVQSGTTGWLVEPHDVGALARALDAALAMDAAQLSEIGAHAREHAKQFSSAAMCEKTLAVYREVLGG